MIGVKKSATRVVTAKCEQRSVIRFLHLKGKDPVIIHQELKDVYGKNAISYAEVWKFVKTFSDNDEVIKEVTNWFNSQLAAFYDIGISNLVSRCDKCINKFGDYWDLNLYQSVLPSIYV